MGEPRHSWKPVPTFTIRSLMPQKLPPPSPLGRPSGAPALPHAESICEPGYVEAARSEPDPEPVLSGYQPIPLVPAPPSVLVEPLSEAAISKATIPVSRKGPISFLSRRSFRLPSPSPTMVPDESMADEFSVPKALVPKIIISQFRAMRPDEKTWALPARVGSMVQALNVPGLGWVRYAGTIAVMVDFTEMDLQTGKKTVYVSVCYGPDPGNGVMKRKFQSNGRERFRQLEEAIAYAFTEVVPVCGLVLRLTGGPPTMTDADMAVAGYAIRAGKDRAPVRAEFVFSAIQAREVQVKKVYEDVEEHFFLWRYLFLCWWWCFNPVRLAAYHMGERLVEFEGVKNRFVTIMNRSLMSKEHHAVIEREVALLARWPVASFASLLWENEACRAALVEKGIKVREIAGTCLGTYMDDEED